MFEFVELLFRAYLLGPVVAIPYALNIMKLDPLTVFILLAVIYIAPLPLILWVFEFGGHHRRLYKNSIFKKFSKTTKKQMHEVISASEDIERIFEERIGHLGFYLAISVFTILFGIFWAAFFAYILKVEKIKAILAMAAGILAGDAFWLLVSIHFLPNKGEIEILALFVLMSLIMYGRKREMDVIKWIAQKMRGGLREV